MNTQNARRKILNSRKSTYFYTNIDKLLFMHCVKFSQEQIKQQDFFMFQFNFTNKKANQNNHTPENGGVFIWLKILKDEL
jgi:hypothetical protein